MAWVEILIGLVVLTMGRRLFWLFVAAVGFASGVELAPLIFPGQPQGAVWLVAVVAGIICAVLAYVLQWAAIAAAGFLVGGRIAVLVAAAFFPEAFGFAMPSPFPGAALWSLPFLIGGAIGALITLLFFDWALILLSSIAGAMLIAAAAGVGPRPAPLVVAGLAVVGVAVQAASQPRSGALATG